MNSQGAFSIGAREASTLVAWVCQQKSANLANFFCFRRSSTSQPTETLVFFLFVQFFSKSASRSPSSPCAFLMGSPLSPLPIHPPCPQGMGAFCCPSPRAFPMAGRFLGHILSDCVPTLPQTTPWYLSEPQISQRELQKTWQIPLLEVQKTQQIFLVHLKKTWQKRTRDLQKTLQNFIFAL